MYFLDDSSDDFSKLNVEIRVIPTISPTSPILLQRLSPQRSNIRASSASTDSAEDTSTPLYNTALLLATVPRAHLLRVYSLQQSVPAFSDALTMLKVWANQRGYGQGNKLSMRGFESKGMWWAAVLDLLINGEEPLAGQLSKASSKRKPLGKGLSSYQLFRAALDFFGKLIRSLRL
jgi:U3 small nucleolar RNA-associated protein 22